MEKDSKDKEFKKTQSTSAPGALGEDANRDKRSSDKPIGKDHTKTSKEEGLNQERSARNSGSFVGPDTPGDV